MGLCPPLSGFGVSSSAYVAGKGHVCAITAGLWSCRGLQARGPVQAGPWRLAMPAHASPDATFQWPQDASSSGARTRLRWCQQVPLSRLMLAQGGRGGDCGGASGPPCHAAVSRPSRPAPTGPLRPRFQVLGREELC